MSESSPDKRNFDSNIDKFEKLLELIEKEKESYRNYYDKNSEEFMIQNKTKTDLEKSNFMLIDFKNDAGKFIKDYINEEKINDKIRKNVLIQFGFNMKNTKEDKEHTEVHEILKEEDENEKL